MDDRNIHNTGIRSAGDKHGLGWQMASARPLPEPEDVLPSRNRLQRVATIMAVLGIAAMFAGLVTPWVNQYCPNNTTVDTIGPCAPLPMQVALGNGPYQVATPALLLGFWAVPFGGGGFMNFSGFYLATLFGVIVIEVVLAWSSWRLMSPRRKRWTNAVWIYPIFQLYLIAVVWAEWLAIPSAYQIAAPFIAPYEVGHTVSAGPGLFLTTAGLALMVLALATVWLGSLLARRHQAAAHEVVPVADAAGA